MNFGIAVMCISFALCLLNNVRLLLELRRKNSTIRRYEALASSFATGRKEPSNG